MNILLKIFFTTLYLTFLISAQADLTIKDSKPTELEPGYIHLSEKNHLFYLLAKSSQSNAPLVIFLNGGPGASSMGGAFVVNGPYSLSKPFQHDTNFLLTKNPWSWHQIANVIYLDQPRHVGYSYGDEPYITSLQTAGEDFLKWLQLFYQRYPEFAHRPLYLSGESFASSYIAQYAHQILQHNKVHSTDPIHLAGLFVLSGAITDDVNPQNQLYFLCTQSFLPPSTCTLQQEK